MPRPRVYTTTRNYPLVRQALNAQEQWDWFAEQLAFAEAIDIDVNTVEGVAQGAAADAATAISDAADALVVANQAQADATAAGIAAVSQTEQTAFDNSTGAADNPTIDLKGNLRRIEDVSNAPGKRLDTEFRASSVLATTDDGDKERQGCFPGSGRVLLTNINSTLDVYDAIDMSFIETFSGIGNRWVSAVKVVDDFVYGFQGGALAQLRIADGVLIYAKSDGPTNGRGMSENGGTIFVAHSGETYLGVQTTVTEWDAATGVMTDFYNLTGIGSNNARDVEVDDVFIYILDSNAGQIRKFDRATKTEQTQVAVTDNASDLCTLEIVGLNIYYFDTTNKCFVFDTATLTPQFSFTLPKSVNMSNIYNGMIYSTDSVSGAPAADKISFAGFWLDKTPDYERSQAKNISWKSEGNTRFVGPELVERNADAIEIIKAPRDYMDLNATAPAPPEVVGRFFWDSVHDCPAYYDSFSGTLVQIPKEIPLNACNDTGAQINNGQLVCATGSDGTCLEVSLANAGSYTLNQVIAVATTDVPTKNLPTETGIGKFTLVGDVHDFNTSHLTEGKPVYADIIDGGITSDRPVFPAKPIIVGHCVKNHATEGIIYVDIAPDQYAYEFEGCVFEQQDYEIVVDGGVIYADVEKLGGGDLPVPLEGQIHLLNCTTGAGVGGKARVALTAGTDSIPKKNFFHVILSGGVPTLVSSTTQATGAFAPIGRCSLWSAAKTITDGPLGNRRTTDAVNHDGKGRIHYIDDRLRDLGAAWKTGVNPTATITPNGGALDVVDFEVLSGTVKQLQLQNFPALSIDTSGIYIANASGAGALTNGDKITGLEQALETVDGTVISGRRFNFFIFGLINMKTSQCKLMLNLPTDTYGTDASAYRDSSFFTPTNADDSISEYAFAIARIPLRHTPVASGTITFINGVGQTNIIDMRGVPMNTSATGVGGASGITQVSEAADTDISNPVNDEVLKYVNGLLTNTALTLDEVADTATRVAITPAQKAQIGDAESIWTKDIVEVTGDISDVPGAQVIANPDFKTDVSSWTVGNSATVTWQAGGIARVAYNGVTNPYITQSSLINGDKYRITGRMRGDGTNIPVVNVGTMVWEARNATDWESFSVYFTVTSTLLQLSSGGATSGYVEFDYAYAYAVSAVPTMYKLPTWITRENLLPYPLAIDNWTKVRCTINNTTGLASPYVDPDLGQMNYEGIVADSGTGTSYIYQSITATTNTISVSFIAKHGDYDFMVVDNISIASLSFICNIKTGELGSVQGAVEVSIKKLEDGSVYIQATIPALVGANNIAIGPVASSVGGAVTGDGTTVNTYLTRLQVSNSRVEDSVGFANGGASAYPQTIKQELTDDVQSRHADGLLLSYEGAWLRACYADGILLDDSPANELAASLCGYKKRLDNNLWETPQDDVVYYNGTMSDGSDVYYIKTSGTLSAASTAIMSGLTVTGLLTVSGYGTSDDGLTQYMIGSDDLKVTVTLSGGTVNLIAGADLYGSSNPYFAAITFI